MSAAPVYLSKEGLVKFKEELEHLRTVKRPEVAKRIEIAKEHGDLRENAEYHDARDEAAFVDGRIMELDEMLRHAIIIEGGTKDAVSVGSSVDVTYDGKAKTFSVVGSHEADPVAGRISNESPIGKALLGKKVGDTADVQVPAGTITYTITAIR
jgi:transcription elongation factor GreA